MLTFVKVELSLVARKVAQALFTRMVRCTAGDLASRSTVTITIVIAVASLFACSDRPRSNPLDPLNPDTGGKPAGLTLVSILDTIRLSWNAINLEDLSGFRLYRKLEGEPDFTLLAEVPAGVHQYEDRSNRYGMAHSYRISARAGQYESSTSQPTTITPGPTVAWVADLDDRAVVKLTHDGQHEVLRASDFDAPFRLKADAARGSVWVLEYYTGALVRLDQHGTTVGVHDHFSNPIDLVLDPSDGSVWVAEAPGRGLVRYDAEGQKIVELSSVQNIGAISLNQLSNELWAVVTDGDTLVKVSQSSHQVQNLALPATLQGRPEAMSIHQESGAAWIALADRVFRIDASAGNPVPANYEFRRSSRLAVDQRTGECWVIDESNSSSDSRVVKIDANGQVVFSVSGFHRPQGLAVNPYDSSCFIADTLTGRVVRIDSTGTVIPAYGNLLSPFDIDIAYVAR